MLDVAASMITAMRATTRRPALSLLTSATELVALFFVALMYNMSSRQAALRGICKGGEDTIARTKDAFSITEKRPPFKAVQAAFSNWGVKETDVFLLVLWRLC